MNGPMTAEGTTEVALIDLPAERRRGLGELRCESPEGTRVLPLAGVSLRAKVADRVAEVEVEQKFQNPYAEALEATYIFPLGGGSAVSRFELQVGARVLKGKVEERGEARRQYQQAVAEGKRAALLEQERDDVFTVQVGNLPPGEEVTVRLAYAEKLPFFEDGMTELRLPLVVAPRYIPGQPIDSQPNAGSGTADDTDRVPDASRITPPRLAPGFDPKVSLQIEVELLHGAGKERAGLAELSCSQHATRVASGPETSVVSLQREKEPLDRDFVLRWRLAAEKLSSSLIVYRDQEGEGFALLSMLPPRAEVTAQPRDVVFVVDRSGSMSGQKMISAARACSSLLETLGPRDRFAIQAFDNQVESFAHAADVLGLPIFTAAGEGSIEKAKKWLRGIEARGGTELTNALDHALGLVAARKDGAGRVPVIVLLTDGEVGDERSALRGAQEKLGEARIFTVGIDTAVNDGFLKRLAQLGRGTASFVEPGAQLEDALRIIAREIGAPVAVDLAIEDVDAGLVASSMAPARLPDLFAGRGATCAFRLAQRKDQKGLATERAPGSVRVTGKLAGGGKLSQVVEVREAGVSGLAHIYARARVADLEDQFRLGGDGAVKKEIVELALRHTLLTRFTAFVVVDESEVVNSTGQRHQISQPVEMPAGWDQMLGGGAPPLFAHMAMAMPSESAAMPVRALRKRSLFGGLFSKKGKAAPPEDSEDAFDAPHDKMLMSALKGGGGGEHIGGGASWSPPAPKPLPALTADEKKKLGELMDQLRAAFAQVRAELAAGRVPSADALDQVRTELLEQPATQWLLQLERFARATLFSFITALRAPEAKAKALRKLADQHLEELKRASAEVDQEVGGSAPRRFWEASI